MTNSALPQPLVAASVKVWLAYSEDTLEAYQKLGQPLPNPGVFTFDPRSIAGSGVTWVIASIQELDFFLPQVPFQTKLDL